MQTFLKSFLPKHPRVVLRHQVQISEGVGGSTPREPQHVCRLWQSKKKRQTALKIFQSKI